jgi:hypothetical protein
MNPGPGELPVGIMVGWGREKYPIGNRFLNTRNCVGPDKSLINFEINSKFA